jgi:hypothetical protein
MYKNWPLLLLALSCLAVTACSSGAPVVKATDSTQTGAPAAPLANAPTNTAAPTPAPTVVAPVTAPAPTVADPVAPAPAPTPPTSPPPTTVVIPAATGSASLAWTPPTQNTDGSTLTDLRGYRIYHGTSAASLSVLLDVANPGITTSVVDNLGSGTHYFAISAYNAAGAESARSAIGSKTIL